MICQQSSMPSPGKVFHFFSPENGRFGFFFQLYRSLVNKEAEIMNKMELKCLFSFGLSPLELFSLPQGYLEQAGVKVMLSWGWWWNISPSLCAFHLHGRGPWMRGLAIPNLHTGTNPDCEKESSNKTSKCFCSQSGIGQVECLGAFSGQLGRAKRFRSPTRGGTSFKPVGRGSDTRESHQKV